MFIQNRTCKELDDVLQWITVNELILCVHVPSPVRLGSVTIKLTKYSSSCPLHDPPTRLVRNDMESKILIFCTYPTTSPYIAYLE